MKRVVSAFFSFLVAVVSENFTPTPRLLLFFFSGILALHLLSFGLPEVLHFLESRNRRSGSPQARPNPLVVEETSL
ncbi:hypothetical protein BJ508DRAFT_40831 [Ascobolus immersus RN42]|uniref:Uncharacterized protein n=1 Tax=Ascobolus immersus RN42 TaxID=1160509 RepID=A0A3N4HJG2_ASCIM|nr:hypothetical protein BJ508DRAFT_40831 [Ascobolus immersus RN42]